MRRSTFTDGNLKHFSLSFTGEEWIEIEAALFTKIGGISMGRYGPEDRPGEDVRWIKDLWRIRDVIQQRLYGRRKVKLQ